MKNIVINACFGGFGLSHAATMEYARLKGFELTGFHQPGGFSGNFEVYNGEKNPFIIYYLKGKYEKSLTSDEFNTISRQGLYFTPTDIPRDDEALVKVVKKMKEAAETRFSKLKVIKIPDDVQWEIDEYDGNETIHEKHRSWN